MGRRRQTPGGADSVALEAKTAQLPTSLRALITARTANDDPLKWVMKQIPGGTKAVYRLLSLSDDPDAARIVEAWRRLQATYATRGVDLYEIIEHADLTPRDFVGIVSRVAFDFNIALGHSIAAMHYPKMMQASMKRAQEAEATDERKVHFQASGYLPTGKGIQIGIKNTVALPDDAPPAPGRPASFDRTARQVVRELPPPRSEDEG